LGSRSLVPHAAFAADNAPVEIGASIGHAVAASRSRCTTRHAHPIALERIAS
jgi:hypothetical protein